MFKKVIYLMSFISLLVLNGAVQADYQAVFSDDFSTAHDYLASGVGSTGWDGFLGNGPYETANVIQATGGELYLESGDSWWHGPFLSCDPNDPDGLRMGPFLYKVVSGDFIAEVTITDINGRAESSPVYNDCGGLMARVGDLAAGGDCEDWVQNTIMPSYDVGNKWDNVNGGVRAEMNIQWNGPWNYNNRLRLQRAGNSFSFYMYMTSPWPHWEQLGSLPFTRDDMEGPLQVGIWQGVHSDVNSWVKFDDFSLTYTVYEEARLPIPSNGATGTLLDVDLSWVAGDFAPDGHELYFGTDEDAVTDGTWDNHPGLLDFYVTGEPNYDPGLLGELTTYYWRVDEVNGTTRYKGNVWSFTTESINASNPNPIDGSSVRPEVTTTLSWTPSPYVATQNLYFGTSFEDANRNTNPDYEGLGYGVGEVNIPEDYMPLVLEQDYYWRVDTINEPNTWRGNIWSFSTGWKVFEDDFNTPHDYLEDGILGTGWDGFVGSGSGETANYIQTDLEVDHPNELYLESENSWWGPPHDPLGPFLYKEVYGDFIATVQVTDYLDVQNNDCGIMARASMDPDVAGGGEDWVCIHYFPIWNVGIIARYCDNGSRTEDTGGDGTAWDADTYLRLERTGNTFRLYTSPDPDVYGWTEYPDAAFSPLEREDLTGLPVQVGLIHATYSGNTGYAAFDDFSLYYSLEVPHSEASMPSPADGATGVDAYTSLQWLPGDFVQDVNGHEVYFGTDFNDVNTSVIPDFNVSDPCVVPGPLEFGTTYYWRVDEVNEPTRWRGDVWSFTVEIATVSEPNPRDGQSIWAYWLEKKYGNKLYWTPSSYAVSQEFYFGADANNLVSQGVISSDANSVSIPAGYLPLENGEDYFWRINTDNGSGMEAGSVWSFTTASIVFYDDFNDPWDYVSKGPNNWEGVLFSESLTELIIEEDRSGTDPCYPDELVIQSGDGWWAGNPDNAYGPYLYKEVSGDFLATFYIADYPGIYDANGVPDPNHEGAVYHNSIGLMARVGDIDAAGDGEDWVSIDYFPIWGVGVIARYCDDGGRVEDGGGDGTAWDADRYLQLERIGDDFHLYSSADGIHWNEYPDSDYSPMSRPDMNGLPVQIGISHATFSTTVGLGAIDDFILIRRPWPNARGPRPAIGEEDAPINAKLRWTAGDFVQDVNGHYVYFGSDSDEVYEANATNHPNVDLYKVSDPYCDPGILTFSTQYYWRVDEVNGGEEWTGDVWRFTTADYIVVDNFELYSTRDEVRAMWKDGYVLKDNGSNITLSSIIDSRYPAGHEAPGPVYEGSDALQFVYDNDRDIWIYVPGYGAYNYGVSNYYSEMEVNIVDLDGVSNWELEGVKMLSLHFYGDPGNAIDVNEQMYLAVEDIDGDYALVKYGDSIGEDVNNLLSGEWTEWAVSLQEFKDVNANLDLTDIKKVYVGFGNRASPASGGSGVVYLDSIRLYRPKCVPSVVVDLTGDCTMDIDDFIFLSNSWRGKPSTATPIIDLDANDLAEGPVTTWANKVTPLGGQFDINATDVNDNPVRETVAGRAAVTFDGNDYLIADFNAPGDITGANDFTVITTVYNPAIAGEEWVIQWSRRGGPDGTYAAVGYGTNATYGVAAHWGDPDMGFDGGVPGAGEWHQIAVVYDGVTEKVLVDGELNAIESKTLDIYDDDPITVGSAYFWDPNDPNNYVQPTIFFSGSVARIQVYDEALGQHQLEYIATGKFSADINGDGKIDFKDLAAVVDEWLYEKLFPLP